MFLESTAGERQRKLRASQVLSEPLKTRFGEGSVIPIWFTTAPPSMFDESSQYGGYTYDPGRDSDVQVQEIAELLTKKLAEEQSALAI